jgi:hypothetical protein
MKNGHLKYGANSELINSLISPGTRLVTGQYVAHTKRTLVERAYEAADLYHGQSPARAADDDHVGLGLAHQCQLRPLGAQASG